MYLLLKNVEEWYEMWEVAQTDQCYVYRDTLVDRHSINCSTIYLLLQPSLSVDKMKVCLMYTNYHVFSYSELKKAGVKEEMLK